MLMFAVAVGGQRITGNVQEYLNNTVLGGHDVLETLARELAAGAKLLSAAMHAHVWFYDGQDLVPFQAEPGAVLTEAHNLPGYDLAWKCYRSGQVEARGGFQHRRDSEHIRSMLGIPLSIASSRVGALVVADSRSLAFDPRETAMLQMVCSLFGLAVHHCSHFPDFLPYWSACIGMRADFCTGTHDMSFPWIGPSGRLPKGINEPTLHILCHHIAGCSKALSVGEIAPRVGLSGVSIRRYLSYLEELGLISRGVRYPQTGRPSYVYWMTAEQAEKVGAQEPGIGGCSSISLSSLQPALVREGDRD